MDSECRLDGREGRCEAIDYCAYPNDRCDVGFSYSPYAPDGIANTCVEQDNETGEQGEPQCEGDCEPLEEFGRWTVDAPTTLIDAALLGEAVVIGGNVAGQAHIVALSSNTARVVPEFTLVALATSGERIMVGGNEGAMPALFALEPSLETVWERRWSTGEDDIMVGTGAAMDGGAVVGGRAYGRPWVEQVDADGATQWSQQWDASDSPVQLLLARGGLIHAIGADPEGVQARTFTSRGAMAGPFALSSLPPTALLGGTTSTTGITWITPEQVWASGHDLSTPLELALPSAAAAALDGANNLIIARVLDALTIETYDPQGTLTGSVELSVGPIDGIVALHDVSARIVLVARVGQDEVVAWRIAP